ncbi:flagellar assembly factor FliW [Thermosyntropha lipolytica DSM 11003]|uniref:Flagellar assembly factor FliW n=1 Tax=Thermosyntropha lipolytica DSM 11003 TaxID=1123382 RepID=A0A1M5KN82_9FIRM|nr:flagellar assembly protein FliW [Thermosyntropha lipolytica]SHG54272.1 flagellar assembly factor FliW [Thermosyntropha lipolytica DSM 11003]
MQIASRVLGKMEIEENSIIKFPEGLPAFEEEKEFVIIPLEEGSPFYYMQAVGNEELCFMLADPFVFFPAYEIKLGDEVVRKLKLKEKGENIAVFVILTVPDDYRLTTANLLAPLIINTEEKIGLQFVAVDSDYNTKHFIFPGEAEKIRCAAGEGR